MSKIAFVGLGSMGEPMAANLLRKGYSVTVVQHRRPDPAKRLREQGAKVVTSAIEAAADCDAAILSLPTSREVEGVVLGERGLLGKMTPGSLLIDCSTSDPESTARIEGRLKENGIGFVAAAMTRGIPGARQGTLAFFVGGASESIEKAKPILSAMGNLLVQFGSASHAHAAKVICNVLNYSAVALVNEALMLGAQHGLDLDALHKAIMEQTPSRALEAFGPRIVASKYDSPIVTVDHACADMSLLQQLAGKTNAPVFLMAAAQELYRLLNARGHGRLDVSAVGELWHDPRSAS